MGVALRKNTSKKKPQHTTHSSPFTDDAKLLTEIENRIQKQTDPRAAASSSSSSSSPAAQPTSITEPSRRQSLTSPPPSQSKSNQNATAQTSTNQQSDQQSNQPSIHHQSHTHSSTQAQSVRDSQTNAQSQSARRSLSENRPHNVQSEVSYTPPNAAATASTTPKRPSQTPPKATDTISVDFTIDPMQSREHSTIASLKSPAPPQHDLVAKGVESPTMSSASPENAQPNTILRWHKGGMIGSGSYGRVYLGLNMDTGELIAVKQIPLVQSGSQESKALSALAHEVNLMKSLQHPNIVRYLGSQEDDENLNIFLEYVPGGSIKSLLSKFGSFNEKLVRIYTNEILQGLNYLHSVNVVHRDIKGANTLVDTTGRVKLADFGASKIIDSTMRSLKGTPYWMAPEVIRQEGYGKMADVWSVGCTVIEMMTGNPPWSHVQEATSALFQIARSKNGPTLPSNMSPEGHAFLSQCFKRIPSERSSVSVLLQHGFVRNIDAFVESGGTTPTAIDESATKIVAAHHFPLKQGQPDHQPSPAIATPPMLKESTVAPESRTALSQRSVTEETKPDFSVQLSSQSPGLGSSKKSISIGDLPTGLALSSSSTANKDLVSSFVREQVMLQTKKLMTADICTTLQKMKKPSEPEGLLEHYSNSLKQETGRESS
eukprot:TRINITY_DN5066_c0_g1_i1.p1 TRINITY_DN5066_c0_g1~~TRINITY_DN5066_c0_g1_i1.p1  ORF type:complete len:658 (-),score=147.29 TRINITY_DN5066_c0_g1_i1:94-2067(-)